MNRARGEFFAAPWGPLLQMTTAFSCLLLLGIAGLGWLLPLPSSVGGPVQSLWWVSMVGLPLGILAGGALFTIRGYVLTAETLWVERLGWRSRISLAGLQAATFTPQAMNGSLRTFGNGGLFCFAGRFWSRSLGHYRAFATHLDHTVVLRFEHHTIVVTPARPPEFVQAIATRIPTSPTTD